MTVVPHPDPQSEQVAATAPATQSWRQMAATADAASAEKLSDWFSERGALSVTFEDAADQPVYEPKPGETPIWQATRVVALFDADFDTAALRRELLERSEFGVAQIDEETIEDRPWERVWLEHFKPMRFGRRLWICPSALPRPEEAADGVCVDLDPGLAFGTGNHATTALCLEWLDHREWAGKTVLDYGCGSGILAIAALLLGAERAYGVDIDPQALLASQDNAVKNGVAEWLVCAYPERLPDALQVDAVCANILAMPLIELAPRLAAHCKPGGGIVLSGLLEEQATAVQAAYLPYFRLDPVKSKEGWAGISGVKR